MFYRVIATLTFTEQDEATDFYYDCQKALAKSQIINPTQLNREVPSISLHECHHDETPHGPCILLKENHL